MSKGLKIVLIVVAVLVVLGGTCVAGFVFWLESHREELEQMGAATKAEGENFGTTTDADGCVDEALRRGAECDGIVCEAGASIFLRACLDTAVVPDGYCNDVPSPDSVVGAVRFRLAVCEEKAPDDAQRCGRIIDSIQEYCHAEASE